MKKLTLTLLTAFLLFGCSDDSGNRKATTTSGNGGVENNRGYNNGSSGQSDVCANRGYNCTPGNNSGGVRPPGNNNGGHNSSGYTPAAYGESSFGGVTIAYNASSGNSVNAEGILDLDQKYGFLDCEIPKGSYNIRTRNSGQVGNSAHHYQNIQVNIGDNITGVLENVVAMENTQGQWVQDVRIKINTVSGNDCNYLSLYFAMPLAN